MTTVSVIIVLGILQLAAGIVIGRCFPIGHSKKRRSEALEAGRLQAFASRLNNLITSVADDVGEHQTQIRHVNEELSSIDAAAAAINAADTSIDTPATPIEATEIPTATLDTQIGTAPTSPDVAETLTNPAATPADEIAAASLAGVILKSVTQIMQINEHLQDRLSTSEDRLQQQTKQMQSHINEARTDPLTGLPNRRAFNDELNRCIAEWRRRQVPFCLIMLDIDHFKVFNDRYGHPVGDRVLQNTAVVFQGALRDMDMIARVGGEEFAAILPGTDSRHALQAAERVRTAVETSGIRSEQAKLQVTVSLGVAMVAPGDDAASLVKRADKALYASKNAGRNCGHFHNTKTCEPIPLHAALPDDHVEPPPFNPPPGVLIDPELEAACDNLRNCVTDVTGQP